MIVSIECCKCGTVEAVNMDVPRSKAWSCAFCASYDENLKQQEIDIAYEEDAVDYSECSRDGHADQKRWNALQDDKF